MILDLPLKILLSMLLSGHMTYGTPGNGFYLDGPTYFVVLVLGSYVSLFFVSMVWLYGDARSRDKNTLITMLLILLFGWPASFVFWFWLRPPRKLPIPAVNAGYALPTASLSTI
jgi:hypothetical protein